MWALAVTQMHNYFPLKILCRAFVDELHSLYKLEAKGGQTRLQTLALQDKRVQNLQRIRRIAGLNTNGWRKLFVR